MRGSGAPLHFIDVARPVARRISGERSPIQVKKAANEATKGISKGERDFLHIYHYNGWHSSEYHSYNDTYKFTILISRLLHFYHIYLCGTPRRPDTLAYSQQRMRNVVIAPDLLLSSPLPIGGSHSFSHCQVGPTGQTRLLPPAPLPSSALQARWRRWGSRRRGGRARPRPGRLVSAGAHGSSVQARTWGGCD